MNNERRASMSRIEGENQYLVSVSVYESYEEQKQNKEVRSLLPPPKTLLI